MDGESLLVSAMQSFSVFLHRCTRIVERIRKRWIQKDTTTAVTNKNHVFATYSPEPMVEPCLCDRLVSSSANAGSISVKYMGTTISRIEMPKASVKSSG